MAKSTKNQDKLPSFEEFRAPWETEAGNDAEIDKSKLKKFIFNLFTDKAKAQDARDDALADVETVTAERDEAKQAASDAQGADATKTIEKLTKERDAAVAEVKTMKDAQAYAELRAEVIGDLDPKYAKYVKGQTKEELEKSLEEVKKDFDIKDGNEDQEDEILRTRPRSRLANPLDDDANRGSSELDVDKVAEQILGNRLFG